MQHRRVCIVQEIDIWQAEIPTPGTVYSYHTELSMSNEQRTGTLSDCACPCRQGSADKRA